MMIFGHSGPSALVARKIFGDHDRRMIALAIVLGLLPDLIDKPLAMIWFSDLKTSRIYGHTLFSCVLYFLFLWGLFRNLRLAGLLALFPLGHLILDVIDDSTTAVNMLWPFVEIVPAFGRPYSLSTLLEAILAKFQRFPHTVAFELFGIFYLTRLAFAWRKKSA